MKRAYSFPPLIIYTGRSLQPAEEQRLRRYSSSIIIKGARSPERLLDEVTLFLHQVESALPLDQQKMLRVVRARDAALVCRSQPGHGRSLCGSAIGVVPERSHLFR
jgi:hypothetical protein